MRGSSVQQCSGDPPHFQIPLASVIWEFTRGPHRTKIDCCGCACKIMTIWNFMQVCGSGIWNWRHRFHADDDPQRRCHNSRTWPIDHWTWLLKRFWEDVHVQYGPDCVCLCSAGELISVVSVVSWSNMCMRTADRNWFNNTHCCAVLVGLPEKCSHVQTRCWQDTISWADPQNCFMAREGTVALVLCVQW